MRNYFTLLIFFSLFGIQAQQTKDQIISLAKDQQKEILIPAYKGDTIAFQVNLYNTKKAKISKVAFYEHPNTLLLKIENVKDYTAKVIAKKTAIYKLVLENKNSEPVTYALGYSVASTRKKRPTIGYKVKKDTTYGYETTQYRKVAKTEAVTVQQEKFYVNSVSNALVKGGKNRIVLPIDLPKGTREWYYIFTASRNEEDIKNTLSTFDLASQLTKYMDGDKSLQKAVATLSPPPGADICDIYVIENEINTQLFKEKEDFKYALDGSRENFKSGIVKVDGSEKAYLGIQNPDNLHGIHVGMEIIALVEESEKIQETVNIPIITSYQVPYLIE